MPDIYEIVNSTQLDSDLEDIADAIRAKSQGQSQLQFPNEFISEIGSIPTGASITGARDISGVKARENMNAGDTAYIITDKICKWFDLSSPIGNPAYGAAFSPDDSKLALANSTSPYLHIFSTADKSYAKQSISLSGLQNARDVKWTKDGDYIVVGHSGTSGNTKYLAIFRTSDYAAVSKINSSSLPNSIVYDCAFNSAGTRLAVAQASSPYVSIYDTSGSTWTKLNNPSTLPAGQGCSCAWSPDGTKLAVGHVTTPFITIYDTTTSPYTKLANPATLPTGQVMGVVWSNDGTKLICTHNSSPYITVYDTTTTPFTKLADPASLPAGNANKCSLSPDGKILIVPHAGSPFLTIYNTETTPFTKLQNPSNTPAGNAWSSCWQSNGKYFVVGHASGEQYANVYIIATDFPEMFKAANTNIPGAEAFTLGYSKTSVSAGSTGTAVALFEP